MDRPESSPASLESCVDAFLDAMREADAMARDGNIGPELADLLHHAANLVDIIAEGLQAARAHPPRSLMWRRCAACCAPLAGFYAVRRRCTSLSVGAPHDRRHGRSLVADFNAGVVLGETIGVALACRQLRAGVANPFQKIPSSRDSKFNAARHDAQTPLPLQETYQEVVAALSAAGAGEVMGEDAALEVTAEFALDVAGNRVGVIEFATSQDRAEDTIA